VDISDDTGLITDKESLERFPYWVAKWEPGNKIQLHHIPGEFFGVLLNTYSYPQYPCGNRGLIKPLTLRSKYLRLNTGAF
jgi:hypothetical protein